MEEQKPKEESHAGWWAMGAVAALMAAAVWSERNHVGPHWYQRSFEFWFFLVLVMLAAMWFVPDILKLFISPISR